MGAEMSETDRVIGKLEEFQSWAKAELAELKADVKALNSWKWKVTGMAGLAAFLVSLAFHAFKN